MSSYISIIFRYALNLCTLIKKYKFLKIISQYYLHQYMSSYISIIFRYALNLCTLIKKYKFLKIISLLGSVLAPRHEAV